MLLSRRDFCVRELHDHLQAQGYEAPVVQQVVAELRERGFVDDERYAQQYVALHAERGHGPLRIGRELNALGINPGAGRGNAGCRRGLESARPRTAYPPFWPRSAHGLARQGPASPIFAIPGLFQRSYPRRIGMPRLR